MKAFIAYALVVIGVPMFVGMAIGGILQIPLARFLHSKSSISVTNLIYLEIINAFVASVAGALLFRLFGLTPGLVVPMIMSAWITFYFFRYHQPLRGWVSWLAGIFIGWFTLARMVGIVGLGM